MRTTDRNCSGCRYWSEMIARGGGGTDNAYGDTEAMCLANGPHKGKYTTASVTCDAYARNIHGAVDDPPDYGAESRAAYARDAAMTHPNGAPMFAPDGTMLDDIGERSIFDDVDQ